MHRGGGEGLALVTGGGGFLGCSIVEKLLARGRPVRILARGAYPELEQRGVECVRADLIDEAAVQRACEGCAVVFHVAARAGLAGSWKSFFNPNVLGTRNVLAACRSTGVPSLVYTSSPSVVFTGEEMEGVNESAPYPRRYPAHYSHTKAIAERMVLAAHGEHLRTVALRPHLIWGPRDTHLVPAILSRAHRLRRIGRADKLADSTYIDNAADAHLLAAERLAGERGGGVARRVSPNFGSGRMAAAGEHVAGDDEHARTCNSGRAAPGNGRGRRSAAGRAFFITNGDPRPIWELVNGILGAGGRPPVTRRVPVWAAHAAAVAGEAAAWLRNAVRPANRQPWEPPLTRFLVKELTTAHWFDISAARRDLGYEPKVSIDEGLRRLREWFERGGAPGP